MQQSSPQAYLIIQFGNRWTNVLRLQNQPVFVGRSSENQIVVRDERVRRRHASITPSAEGWSVADLGSRNGTQIDEVSIAAPHNLQEGETIGVGGCRITFSRSLQGAFSASRTAARVSGERGAEFDARMTQDLEGHAAIVHRQDPALFRGEAADPDAHGVIIPLHQDQDVESVFHSLCALAVSMSWFMFAL